MKYTHSVIYNGKFYRAGEEVPVKTKEKASDDNSKTTEPKKEDTGEYTKSEGVVAETKKPSRKKPKA